MTAGRGRRRPAAPIVVLAGLVRFELHRQDGGVTGWALLPGRPPARVHFATVGAAEQAALDLSSREEVSGADATAGAAG